jgi:hypothetical protein
MKDQLETILKLALDQALGLNPAIGESEKRLICRAVERNHWPDEGFPILAREILFRAIARSHPFVEGWTDREYD